MPDFEIIYDGCESAGEEQNDQSDTAYDGISGQDASSDFEGRATECEGGSVDEIRDTKGSGEVAGEHLTYESSVEGNEDESSTSSSKTDESSNMGIDTGHGEHSTDGITAADASHLGPIIWARKEEEYLAGELPVSSSWFGDKEVEAGKDGQHSADTTQVISNKLETSDTAQCLAKNKAGIPASTELGEGDIVNADQLGPTLPGSHGCRTPVADVKPPEPKSGYIDGMWGWSVSESSVSDIVHEFLATTMPCSSERKDPLLQPGDVNQPEGRAVSGAYPVEDRSQRGYHPEPFLAKLNTAGIRQSTPPVAFQEEENLELLMPTLDTAGVRQRTPAGTNELHMDHFHAPRGAETRKVPMEEARVGAGYLRRIRKNLRQIERTERKIKSVSNISRIWEITSEAYIDLLLAWSEARPPPE